MNYAITNRGAGVRLESDIFDNAGSKPVSNKVGGSGGSENDPFLVTSYKYERTLILKFYVVK